MKERPILFSAPMVRSILNGCKTQTRRVLKMPHYMQLEERDDGTLWPWMFTDEDTHGDYWMPCPYGKPGDQLWVRETFFDATPFCSAPLFQGRNSPFAYRADRENIGCHKWTPSIHMPRLASRIQMEITGVRVERLQDISIADAIAEGVEETRPTLKGIGPCLEWRYAYEDLWRAINGPGSWDVNPWVWVIEFKRVKP